MYKIQVAGSQKALNEVVGTIFLKNSSPPTNKTVCLSLYRSVQSVRSATRHCRRRTSKSWPATWWWRRSWPRWAAAATSTTGKRTPTSRCSHKCPRSSPTRGWSTTRCWRSWSPGRTCRHPTTLAWWVGCCDLWFWEIRRLLKLLRSKFRYKTLFLDFSKRQQSCLL